MAYSDWQKEKYGNVVKNTSDSEKAYAKKYSDGLTDTSIMPWGIHKNKAMANVPAKYLLWLYESGTLKDVQVKKYIEENLDALRKEI
jgi:uncharacterized protein (DUF3820 family)